MIQQIRDKAKELLGSGRVECVIGYERASDGVTARPAFIYEPEQVERLIFDHTCAHNLVKYLLHRRGKSTAVVVKPCDSRAINLLLVEKQLERDRLFIIGVVCPGVAQVGWNQPRPQLQPRCQACTQHTPPVYDYLAGEPVEEPPPSQEPYSDVVELEKMSASDRAALWKKHFDRCIRCYACRNVCPGCYCLECFVERLDPLWVGIKIASAENSMWHAIRAFHLAARCVACGECQRVCPVNIPLMLLNRKLEKEVLALFQFQAGMSTEETPPLVTFEKEEKLGIGE